MTAFYQLRKRSLEDFFPGHPLKKMAGIIKTEYIPDQQKIESSWTDGTTWTVRSIDDFMANTYSESDWLDIEEMITCCKHKEIEYLLKILAKEI